MELIHARGIIISVFIISVTVRFLKVSATENFQQYVPCNPGWYFFGEKCYKIFSNDTDAGLSWEKSEESCALNGGHLASINSNELQEFLTVFLLLNSKSNAWIGLHDRVTESNFSWIDGSVYNYTNWDFLDPSGDTLFEKEDCVEMSYYSYRSAIGKWNDEPCSSLRPPLCQVDKIDSKSPDPRFCSVEDGGGWKYLNSCYHIVNEKKSWEDAEKYCEEKYKGYLVSILHVNSEVFLDYIMKLSNLSSSVWIGIKIWNNKMQKWTSGRHVADKKFNEENLHFVNGTCVIKTSWNSWAITSCRNKYPFICEEIKYNVPVLQTPLSDDWKCPQSSKKWLDFGGDSCYYIENESRRKWLEANYECGKKGGTLTSIHSENETNLLDPHVLYSYGGLWIGLRRNYTERDVFEWADGSEMIYQNWREGEPNSIFDMCGELWRGSMKWNDISCYESKGYICKTKKVFSSPVFSSHCPKADEVSANVTSSSPVFSSHCPKADEVSANVTCNLAVSKDQIYSGCIPVGTVVGIVFCTLLAGLLVGVTVYHYQDYWKPYCAKTEKDDFTATCSLQHDKVIWMPQGGEIHS